MKFMDVILRLSIHVTYMIDVVVDNPFFAEGPFYVANSEEVSDKRIFYSLPFSAYP